MNPYRAASVIACRILALYMFALVIPSLQMIFNIFGRHELEFLDLLRIFFVFVLLFAPPILLWIFAPWLSKHITPHVQDTAESHRDIDGETLQVTAFSALGLFFVITYIPRLANTILTCNIFLEGSSLEKATLLHMAIALIGPFFVVSLGLWLFCKAQWFVDLSKRFQKSSKGED